jgi:hypothetical protein
LLLSLDGALVFLESPAAYVCCQQPCAQHHFVVDASSGTEAALQAPFAITDVLASTALQIIGTNGTPYLYQQTVCSEAIGPVKFAGWLVIV